MERLEGRDLFSTVQVIGPVHDGIYAKTPEKGQPVPALTIAFDAPKVVEQITYAPRSGAGNRMVGGVFQGSNTADFSDTPITLFAVKHAPAGEVTINTVDHTPVQYVRFLAKGGRNGSIEDMQLLEVDPGYTADPAVHYLQAGESMPTTAPDGTMYNGRPVAIMDLSSSAVEVGHTFDVSGLPSMIGWPTANIIWGISFGDGSKVVHASSAEHAYKHPGTFTVTLTLKNQFGQTSKVQGKVEVDKEMIAKPIIDLAPMPTKAH